MKENRLNYIGILNKLNIKYEIIDKDIVKIFIDDFKYKNYIIKKLDNIYRNDIKLHKRNKEEESIFFKGEIEYNIDPDNILYITGGTSRAILNYILNKEEIRYHLNDIDFYMENKDIRQYSYKIFNDDIWEDGEDIWGWYELSFAHKDIYDKFNRTDFNINKSYIGFNKEEGLYILAHRDSIEGLYHKYIKYNIRMIDDREMIRFARFANEYNLDDSNIESYLIEVEYFINRNQEYIEEDIVDNVFEYSEEDMEELIDGMYMDRYDLMGFDTSKYFRVKINALIDLYNTFYKYHIENNTGKTKEEIRDEIINFYNIKTIYDFYNIHKELIKNEVYIDDRKFNLIEALKKNIHFICV